MAIEVFEKDETYIMKVLNIHQREISQPKEKVIQLLKTLATRDDLVWPYEQWPRMKLDNSLNIGSKGGHGPIRYFIHENTTDDSIHFEFTEPEGLVGFHKLEVIAVGGEKTKMIHTIDMNTEGIGLIIWPLFIRWLHDALIEDAFDKVEHHFDGRARSTKWSLWVKLWRRLLTPKR